MNRIWIFIFSAFICLFFACPTYAFSLNVMDGDVREVLRSVARAEGINMVLDDSVKGRVSLNLETVSPEEVIRSIAMAKGLYLTRQHNTLIVSASESVAKKAEEANIFPLKYAESQVALEAKIVSIEKSAAEDLGVSWDWTSISHRNSGSRDVTATVEAMVKDGRAEMLSRPNITTLQGREAVINIGGEVPVPSVSVTNSTTTTSIEYRQAGIILRYTPYVGDDGRITAKVHTEVSTPSFVEEMNAYQFQKRSADTMVHLIDGETMIIGGLIGSEESESLVKVPFLGDIPILGNFFRKTNKSKKEKEIMIFLTAKLLP